MTAIFFDTNALYIQGYRDSFTAGSLTADMTPRGVGIRVLHGVDYLVDDAWSAYTRQDGSGFASPDDLMAYLLAQFGMRRPVGLPPLTFTAGENLGGQRAVRVTGDGLVYLASADDPDEIDDTLGISMNAALAGASVTVMIQGEMDDPSWSFSPGALFLGLAGALTQDVPAAPVAAFRQKMATVLSPTRLLVERSFPVLLA